MNGLIPDNATHAFQDREHFALELLLTLSGVLTSAVGDDDTEGFVNLVAHRLGRDLNRAILRDLNTGKLTPERVCEALVELKRRIGGGFQVESADATRIVLVNDRCPFSRRVEGHKPLCMMTSGVFGRIVADNTGYARVAIPESIAGGDKACRVVIHLTEPGDGGAPDAEREYFGA